jgi:hypothetical protein
MKGPFTKSEWVISWVCRITAAVILLQTLFFKFTGAEESVYIFSKIGLEPWGRYGSGVAELIAAVLALGVISGALASHLTVLGIVVKNDGGLLFGLAVTVFICSLITVFLHRRQIPHQCHGRQTKNNENELSSQ